MVEILTSLLETGMNQISSKLPGKLIFSKVWGSYSHNTQISSSDVDYLAIYECPPLDLLSLNPPPDTVDGTTPDFQAHEMRKFCTLLLKGNPGVVECLFTVDGYKGSKTWDSLLKLRHLFLNKVTLDSYLGYCNGQLKRLNNGSRLHTKGGEYNTKWAYHLIRLAMDAERISKRQEPLVWKNTGTAEHTLLMEIRDGQYTIDQIERMFTRIEGYIIENKESNNIPDSIPREQLNEWLVKERERCFLIDER